MPLFCRGYYRYSQRLLWALAVRQHTHSECQMGRILNIIKRLNLSSCRNVSLFLYLSPSHNHILLINTSHIYFYYILLHTYIYLSLIPAAQDLCRFTSRQERRTDTWLAGGLLTDRGRRCHHGLAVQVFATARLQRRWQIKVEATFPGQRDAGHRNEGKCYK